MKNNMIRKHNDLIEACYAMSVPELRLIYSCISKIGFDQMITEKKPFYISALEYSDAFNVDSTNVYREIKKAVSALWNSEITISRGDEKPLVSRWIHAKAELEDGGAEIHFADSVIPYLVNLRAQGNFTIYKLENIGKLKSVYSIRLYELLIQYKRIGVRSIKPAELREMLRLTDKYKPMSDLRKYVLDVALAEINKIDVRGKPDTDIHVTCKLNKEGGRSVKSFDFTIKPSKRPQAKPENKLKYVEPKPKPGESQPAFDARKKSHRKNVFEEQLDLLK